MADNLYNDRKENLNYKDSWLQNSVELAATGAILAGGANLAVKGNMGDATRGLKQAGGIVAKRFDDYIQRRAHPTTRLGYQVGKKTFFNLSKMPKHVDRSTDILDERIPMSVKEVETNPKIQNNIRFKIMKETGVPKTVVNDALNGTNTGQSPQFHDEIRRLYEKLKAEEVRIHSGLKPEEPRKPKTKIFGTPDDKPLFDRKQLTRDAVGSGLMGLGFGAGLTGVHALDRTLHNKDNQEKVEESMQYAGSFLNRKDEKRMDKRAGALETYNTLKALGKKVPEATATGLGFTGVSLGAASLLNSRKNEDEDAPRGSRVIIELGEDGGTGNGLNMAQPPQHASLPKLSRTEGGGLAKLAYNPNASKQVSENWLSGFARNLGGRNDELKALREFNPQEEAARQLKNEDVNALVKQEYGNLANDKTQSQFTDKLFTNRADKLKQENDKRITDVETDVAKARLGAGAGTLAAGGAGLAALGFRNKKEEEPPYGQ